MQIKQRACPCYCTALRSASRRVSSLYDDALTALGISVAQLGLLRAVARKDAQTLTGLGQEVGLDRSTVGRNVRVLERMALLQLKRGVGDLRESTVTLTAMGQNTLAKADSVWASVQKKVVKDLGFNGANRLLALLKKL